MDFGAVRGNLARVREQIAEIHAVAGSHAPVRIVAVTKGHPVEAIRVAAAAGIEDIGENRVQEAVTKREEGADDTVQWHLIGHLQTNKAKFVPGLFSTVHSVDSVRVGQALDREIRRARDDGRGVEDLDVLIQVNVASETQKNGCAIDETPDVVGRIAELATLRVVGLMTMAPLTDDRRRRRRVFADLRALRDRIADHGPALPELSMGMSNDFREAVAEGATMVRLGTALFGERPR